MRGKVRTRIHMLHIGIVVPAPPGSLKGNRITAERWARLLGESGHHVAIAEEYTGQPWDLLIALHAFKSHRSVLRFRADHADAPLVLALTGTDLYSDIHVKPEAMESLDLATRLVLLQPLGITELPARLHDRVRVIYQSVDVPRRIARHHPHGEFQVCVMGHLRPVKAPFHTARAARLLPDSSRVRVLHMGAALSDEMAEEARAEAASNPRYQWLGERPRDEALEILSGCQLLSLTSEQEGGANVISEAVMLGVPVVSSLIAGSVGLLGDDFPGYFPFGDTSALSKLLSRAETDQEFYQELIAHGERRRPLFEPAFERQRWDELLRELFPP
jgi:putative glycosyltransferase (TIGR04348 family)